MAYTKRHPASEGHWGKEDAAAPVRKFSLQIIRAIKFAPNQKKRKDDRKEQVMALDTHNALGYTWNWGLCFRKLCWFILWFYDLTCISDGWQLGLAVENAVRCHSWYDKLPMASFIFVPSEDDVWLPMWQGIRKQPHAHSSHPTECTCQCTVAYTEWPWSVQLRNTTTMV